MAAHFQPAHLDIDFQKFVTADYTKSQWHYATDHQPRELAWLYQSYGGYPDSLVEQNTGFRQLWWNRDDVDFAGIGEQLDMDVVTVSSLRQDPGNIIPLHVDVFYRLQQQCNLSDHQIPVRTNIFLEDSDIGHMLQFVVRDRIVTAASWLAGQGFQFDRNIPHLSLNAGMRPKYTLQISGFARQLQ
jgi:hypothetical protein